MNPCNLFYNKVLKVNYKKFSVLLSKVLCLSLFLRKPAGPRLVQFAIAVK